jgi:hypothetical protein
VAKPLFVDLLTEQHRLQTLIQSVTADVAAIRAQVANIAAIG